MLKMLARTEEGLRSLFALVFPMFAGAAAQGVSSARRWVARSFVVSTFLLLLWRLNRVESLGLKEWVPFGRVGEFWLPLFASITYAIAWLGWLWFLLFREGTEPLSSEFGDIDEAWESATTALAREGIPLDATPVFLVLGASSGPEETFFRSTALRLKVRQVPERPDAPLHVRANDDGIWITCRGASALGQLIPSAAADDAGLGDLVGDAANDPNATYGAGGGATIQIEDIAQFSKFKALIEKEARRPRPTVDLALAHDRLRHLCRLILRDRKGWCPVNGVLVLLSISATDRKADAAEVAGACRADLAVAHEAFRIRCPTLFLVCDLDVLGGFGELVERLPASQVGNRRGQRYPLVPDLDPAEIPPSVKGSVEWIADTYFPSMVYSSFQVESPGGQDLSDILPANSQMLRFMKELQRREEWLADLVRDCLPSLKGEPLMFGGCYFAGTGEGNNRRAFASGVLTRLVNDQDLVTWTRDYLEEDAAYLRRAQSLRILLNLLIALACVAAILLVILLVVFRTGVVGPPGSGAS